MQYKVNRKIVYAKKNLCTWCQTPIKKELFVLDKGEYFCSVKCLKECRKWEKERDDPI